MVIDDKDRMMITEYRGNKVAVFDTKTEEFTEYKLPADTFPYRAEFDKNGELWAGSMHTDRVVRPDPKTGKTAQYPDADRHQYAHGSSTIRPPR